MEFVKAGSFIIHMHLYEMTLKSFLHKKKKNGEVYWLIKGIVNGVHFLHSLGVCHRDLKTENILLDISNEQVKICDFGLGRFAVDTPSTVRIVSPPYRPPEILTTKKTVAVDMYKVDSWSLGCILYEILNKKFLFSPFKSDARQFKNIMDTLADNEWIEKIQSPNTERYCKIIKNCVVVDPKSRMNINQIVEELGITVKHYSYEEVVAPIYFKKFTIERWNKLKLALKDFASTKNLSSTTLKLAKKYMQFYLNKHSLLEEYENLFYRACYYLAIRVNETYFPHMNDVYGKEYSTNDINEMEMEIIRCCEGNMWMIHLKS